MWCNGNEENSGHDKGKKRKRESDEELDTIFRELKQKHTDKYSIPQLRLWARMISCSTHESYDQPPPVPMFSEPQPKRQKESLAESITQGIAAFSKVIQSPPANNSVTSPACGVSPGKNIDLRMKNLEQLRYVQQLYEDNILTDVEFAEQKNNILASIRKLQ